MKESKFYIKKKIITECPYCNKRVREPYTKKVNKETTFKITCTKCNKEFLTHFVPFEL